jgi:hypothetical protein
VVNVDLGIRCSSIGRNERLPSTQISAERTRLDGRLVIAVDESGTRYFKRMRRRGPIIVLESLNPDGLSPSELLSVDGGHGMPQLTHLLEVVGVLFERPD